MCRGAYSIFFGELISTLGEPPITSLSLSIIAVLVKWRKNVEIVDVSSV